MKIRGLTSHASELDRFQHIQGCMEDLPLEEAPEPIPTQDLCEVLGRFKKWTAVGADGWHIMSFSSYQTNV